MILGWGDAGMEPVGSLVRALVVGHMNAQNALELAYDQINSTEKFTYGSQYFKRTLGYLVFMVNETYDTFTSPATPYF
jgi:hypothetical protein